MTTAPSQIERCFYLHGSKPTALITDPLTFCVIRYLQKLYCIIVENISCNKTYLQLRFVLKNKDLKSNVRRINLKWILLNQLKWILDELFRILHWWYQPMQLYLRVGFSSPAHLLLVEIQLGLWFCMCLPTWCNIYNGILFVTWWKSWLQLLKIINFGG